MKELRELLAKGTQGKWTQDVINIAQETFGVSAENDDVIASCGGDNGDCNADLIAAMHNALPELLDAWEMVQAVIEFTDVHRGDVVEVTQDVGYSWCISDLNKILKPYSERDAQKNEGVE